MPELQGIPKAESANKAFLWVKIVFGVLVVGLALALVFSVSGLAKLLVVCALIAYVLDPVATHLECRGLNRTGAVVIVFAGLGALLLGLTNLLYPVFTDQLEMLQSEEFSNHAKVALAKSERLVHDKLGFLGLDKVNVVEELRRGRDHLGTAISNFFVAELVPSIAHFVAMPFIIFFMLRDGREMKKWLVCLVPNRYFELSLDVLYKMDLSLGNFLRGQFLDALVFGVLTMLAMWLLSVKYFLFIGVFAGLANLIPYVGPIVGGSLASMVVLLNTGDLERVALVLIAFLFVKLLDDAFIQPLTVARSVHMHPLLVLLVIIIGGHCFGLLGMLLAVPVTGFLKVAVEAGVSLVRKYRCSRMVESGLARTQPQARVSVN